MLPNELTQRELLDAFIEMHAPAVADDFRRVIRQFEELMGHTIFEITPTDGFRWLQIYSKRKGYKSPVDPEAIDRVSDFSLLNRVQKLKKACEVLLEQNHISCNPFEAIYKSVKRNMDQTQRRPTGMVEAEHVRKLFDWLKRGAKKRDIRDLCLATLLFYGGLRIQVEALQIRLIDIQKQIIKVKRKRHETVKILLRHEKGKGGRSQVFPLEAADAIRALKKQREDEGAGPDSFLFVLYDTSERPAEHAVKYKTARQWWDRWIRCNGLPKTITPHWARATAITRLLDQGLSPRIVKSFSRHSTLHMVELYDKRRHEGEDHPGAQLSYSK